MKSGLVLALCFGLAISVQAQPTVDPPSSDRDGGWASLGMGPGQSAPLAFVLSATFGRTRVLEFAYHVDYDPFGTRTVQALYGGVGLSRVDRWHRVSATVGPAFTIGETRQQRQFTAFGAMGSGQVMLTPVPELGIGLIAYANLNMDRSYVGYALTFVFEANK